MCMTYCMCVCFLNSLPFGSGRTQWPLSSTIWLVPKSSSSIRSPDSSETCSALSTSATKHLMQLQSKHQPADKFNNYDKTAGSNDCLLLQGLQTLDLWPTMQRDDNSQARFTVLFVWTAENRFELHMSNIHCVVRIRQGSSERRGFKEKKSVKMA